MWNLLKISEQNYFISCNFNNKESVTFILYDMASAWSQTLSIHDVKRKVKNLNKRLDFTEDNIKVAMSSGVIQCAVIEDKLNTGTSDLESCVLKIKYRVKNCVLCYDWILKKQNVAEFQQTFVQPILLALMGCHQQVELLTESIRRKDIELKQFRIEGFELNRKTLVTKPFDFENLTKQYEECNRIASNFRELAKHIQQSVSMDESSTINNCFNVNKNDQANKADENLFEEQRIDTKKRSPKIRKRKVNELKMKLFEKHLKVREKGLEYESSQSQISTNSNSQAIEATNRKESQQQKQINEKPQSKFKSCICTHTPVKQYGDNMSIEDKADCDIEDHSRVLRERKTTTKTKSLSKQCGTNSYTGKTHKNSKNNTDENVKKYVLLSNETKAKSSEKSFNSSKVFDFSTDNEDDEPVLKKLKKCEENWSLLKEKKPLADQSLKISQNDLSNDCVSKANTLFFDNAVSVRLPCPSKDMESSTPVIITEISSQLDIIKKELQSLEAMRLADLKQRTCKV